MWGSLNPRPLNSSVVEFILHSRQGSSPERKLFRLEGQAMACPDRPCCVWTRLEAVLKWFKMSALEFQLSLTHFYASSWIPRWLLFWTREGWDWFLLFYSLTCHLQECFWQYHEALPGHFIVYFWVFSISYFLLIHICSFLLILKNTINRVCRINYPLAVGEIWAHMARLYCPHSVL